LEDSALEAHEGWEGPDGRHILGGQVESAHNTALYGAPARHLRGEIHKIGRFGFIDNLTMEFWVADCVKKRGRPQVLAAVRREMPHLAAALRAIERDPDSLMHEVYQPKKSRQQSCRRQIPDRSRILAQVIPRLLNIWRRPASAARSNRISNQAPRARRSGSDGPFEKRRDHRPVPVPWSCSDPHKDTPL
jgi:hypothetical protein